MNILFIAMDYPPMTGGAANFSYEIAKNMPSEKGRLVIVAPRAGGSKDIDSASGLTVFRIANTAIIREIELFFAVLYLVYRFRIDIIYNLIWYPSAAVSSLVNILTGIPYAIHVHGVDYLEDRRGFFNKLKYNRLRMSVKRRAFEGARSILAVSDFTKNMIASDGIEASRIAVESGGVDTGRFAPGLDTRELISKYGLGNKRVLLTVARLSGHKGHDTVINLMPRLLEKTPDVVYMIAGSGGERERLGALVSKMGLEGKVIFAGYVSDSDLPLYYNVCDLFIMLTKEDLEKDWLEGFGLVFLEANSCGKPVIGARTGGITNAVIDGETGFLVDPDNEAEITGRITTLLENRKLAEDLGRKGRERVAREDLTWKGVGRRIYDILEAGAGRVKAC